MTVQASDGTLTDTQAISVTVQPVNDNNPVITFDGGGATASVNVNENNTAVTTVTATDADLPAQTLTYAIAGGADAAFFAIDSNTGALTFLAPPDYEAPADADSDNVYEVTVEVSDGALTDTQAISVSVQPLNEHNPVITSDGGGATANVNVNENDTAVTTVTATDADLPAQTLTYSIAGGADAAFFAIDSNSGALTFLAPPDYEAPADADSDNVYEVTVQVSDGALTDTQAISVSVQPLNDNNPVITSDGGGATASVNVNENDTAVTTVTATDTDLPAQTLTYAIAGGADAAFFAIDSNTGALTFLAAPDYEAPADADSDNVYEVTVQVTDGALTDTQAISVSVQPVNDNNPVITSDGGGATANVNVNENTTAVTTVTATDADLPAQTLTYSIAGGADAAFFAIDSNTGALTFLAPPDYEAPADANSDNVYEVTVQVSDGALTDTQAISVTVQPVNDNNPVITSDGGGATATVNVNENTTAVTTVTATDADLPAQTLTYSIAGGADAALFTIDNSTGFLAFVSGRDRENHTDADLNGIYEVTVQVSDGTATNTQAVSVSVTDVDEFDVGAVTDVDASANTVAEDAILGTAVGITASANDADATNNAITYSLDDDAGGLFAIDGSTGVITVYAALDFETATSHIVTVRATSADGSFATQSFTIQVTDVNETGVTAISDADATADFVLENAANGTAVGVTAFADDPDPSDTVSYSLDNDAGGRFSVDSNTGVVTVAGGIDREAAGTYNITVRATSTDTSTATRVFTITIGDVDEFDVGAVTDVDATANAVDENAGVGTVVGITASARDADATNNTITYSLDDDAGGRFAIDSVTGVVTVVGGLDFESNSSLNVLVHATSADGSGATQWLTIAVRDLNDNAPVIATNLVLGVLENSVAGTSVGRVTASDIDTVGSLQDWQIAGGTGAGVFSIDSLTGEITVTASGTLDFESVSSWTLVVTVRDGINTARAESVTIQVGDVMEASLNNPPVGNPDGYVTYFLAPLTVTTPGVLANDTDVDGDTLTAMVVQAPRFGNLTMANDGSFVYVAIPEFLGQDSFQYQSSDGQAGSGPISVQIEIVPIPPAADHSGKEIDKEQPGGGVIIVHTPTGEVDEQELSTVAVIPWRIELEERQEAPQTAPNRQLEVGGDDVRTMQFQQLSRTGWVAEYHERPQPVIPLVESIDLADTVVAPMEVTSSHIEWLVAAYREACESLPSYQITDSVWTMILNTTLIGASAGYLAWSVRAGHLVATALASTPVWARIDPLAVLDFAEANRSERTRRRVPRTGPSVLDTLQSELSV